MRKFIYTLFALAVAFMTLTLARPAMANETPALDLKTASFATCPNLKDWYNNADEQNDLPDATVDGLEFKGKDLIHHKVDPIDFTDFDKTNKSFEATKTGKVVFKAETSGPYSTIVINVDGKLWSTAFKYDAVGGQGNPIAKAEDLIGKPDAMKPGKVPYTAASRIETIGVGYWVEEGDTVVSSISFHGTKYDLTCKPEPTKTPTSKPTTVKPSASKTSSHAAGAVGSTGNGPSGGALAITGSSTGPVIGFGAAALAVGGGLFLLTRKRHSKFVA